MGGFATQLERTLGRKVPAVFFADLAAVLGLSHNILRKDLDRRARVIPLADVLEGRSRPEGLLMLVVEPMRDGFLIRLWELPEPPDRSR